MITRKSTIKTKKPISSKSKVKKVFTHWRIRIRSRHPSHDVLRNNLKRLPFESVVRLGSTTEKVETRTGLLIECNTVEAIKNSASKLRMKTCFQKANVKTCEWWLTDGKTFYNPVNKDKTISIAEFETFPIVAKNFFGSRGRGNYKLNNKEELNRFLKNHNLSDYLFEKFYNYNREYRLHVDADGCFYTCRKMLKEDTPEDKRWFRNDSNSVWIVEENEKFDKPICWDSIVSECVKALNSVGLDFGACDVRVQSSKTEKGERRKEVDFVIIEINSAPSFGEITAERYLTKIPEILMKKYTKQKK